MHFYVHVRSVYATHVHELGTEVCLFAKLEYYTCAVFGQLPVLTCFSVFRKEQRMNWLKQKEADKLQNIP